MLIEGQAEITAKKWGRTKTTFVVWVGFALAVFILSALDLHASFPFFTVIWLVVPLWIVIRRTNAHQVGYRASSWSKFVSTVAINLSLVLLISALVEPWYHANQALFRGAESCRLMLILPSILIRVLVRWSFMPVAWLEVLIISDGASTC